MKKIEINFDLIDKTYEARGQHNVRRWLRLHMPHNISTTIYSTINIIDLLNGVETTELFISKMLFFFSFAGLLWVAPDVARSISLTKETKLNYKERAYAKLLSVSMLLMNEGIDIAPKQMMEAEIYKKKYKLAMDGRVGIIRERYFEVPFTDKVGDENQTSIKEEHLLGSKKYVLSFDKPAEQVEYKLAYSMWL